MTDKATYEMWIKDRDSRIKRLQDSNSLLRLGLTRIVKMGAIGSHSVEIATKALIKAGFAVPKREDDE